MPKFEAPALKSQWYVPDMIEKTGRKGAAYNNGGIVTAAMRTARMAMLWAATITAGTSQCLSADRTKFRILNDAPVQAKPTTVERPQPENPAKLGWTMSWWGLPRPATAGSERLAELIQARTNGRWTLKIHYGAALSRADRNLDGLRDGRFQMAAFCDFFHPKKNPALTVLSLPFLPIADPKANRRVRDAAYLHPAVRTEFKRLGIRLYVSTYLPPFELIGRGTPPSDLTYWQGRAVRAGSGIGRALKSLGAIPVNATIAEIADGMRDGAIQAAALPLGYALTDSRIRAAATWYTSNLAAGSSECPIAISEAAYAKLPETYKQLLAALKPTIADTQIRAYPRPDGTVSTAGLRRIFLTPAEVAAYRNAAGHPVIDAWIERHRSQFDALDLVRKVFVAGGARYE